jgi:hypothetical protein
VDDSSLGVNGEVGKYFVAYRKSANVLSLLPDSAAGDQDQYSKCGGGGAKPRARTGDCLARQISGSLATSI